MLNLFSDFMPHIVFAPDNGGGGSSSGNGDGAGGNDAPPPDPTDGRDANPERGFRNLADREGGYDAAGLLLYQENYQLRERVRDLQGQVERLEEDLPAGNATVLSQEQADQWRTYRRLGTLDELRQVVDDRRELRRQMTIRDVAEAHGYKAAVLERLVDEDTAIELRTETGDDDQPRRVAYVTPAGDEGADTTDPIPLPDYAAREWADFLPALQAAQRQGGVRWPEQRPSGQGPRQADAVDQTLSSRYSHVTDTD